MQPYKLLALPAIFLVTHTNSLAQGDLSGTQQKIDSLFQCYSADKPGGQLAVSVNGQVPGFPRYGEPILIRH
ncbi:hypothetical protein D3C87_1843950 [compost metagenome]